MKLVLGFSLSMNSATKVLGLMFDFKRTPSLNSGKSWMLKLGYYKLMQDKEIATDWIWIIDHTIQMGKELCMVILGIRAKDLPKTRALKYEDMEIIDLEPIQTSTGDIVFEQLKNASKKTGLPLAIVSDNGSDIKNGVKKFQEFSPSTVHIYDIKHKIAILIKKILESDEQWSKFKKFANFLVKKLQNTSLAGYRPPAQRNKARYMNIEQLVKWGEKIIIKKEILDNKENKTEDEIKLQTLLEDVMGLKDDIKAWGEMVKVISTVERFMNIHNLQSNSYEKFYELHGSRLEKLETTQAKLLSTQLFDFIKEQQKVCKEDERLLHSSQILESLFGKLKFLEKEQARGSFTSLLLSVGAMVSKTTDAVVKTAMETVNTSTIKQWCQDKIGFTIQAQRRELYELENGMKVGYY